jgi:hypothetical protein
VLQLADDQWLAALSAVTIPGLNVVDERNAALQGAFFDGLQQQSRIVEDESEQEALDDGPLAGRLNLDEFRMSPGGVPTQVAGCASGTTAMMAVPIPPAAMATLGAGLDAQVGWCEGEVTFSADASSRQATQLDYSDLSTFTVDYNSWGQSCDALHCNEVFDATNEDQGRSCTVLAVCEPNGSATVVGYNW